MKKATTIIIVIATTVAIFACLKVGLDRNEAVECDKWLAQSAEYDGFYLLQWQKNQCTARGIFINAPVK